MSKILLFSGLGLVLIWAIGLFVFHANTIIHILLFISAIVLFVSLLYNKAFMK